MLTTELAICAQGIVDEDPDEEPDGDRAQVISFTKENEKITLFIMKGFLKYRIENMESVERILRQV